MPGVKTRRGEVQYAEKKTCKDCGTELKPVLYMDGGKKTNRLMCDCGVFDKTGNKVHSFS